MTEYVQIKDAKIPIVIRSYKTSRHLKMYFKADVLYISKPKYVTKKKAIEFVEENKLELYNKYQKIREQDAGAKYWNTGDTFSLKGEKYTIDAKEIENNKIKVQINNEDKKIYVEYPDGISDEAKKENIDKVFIKLLRNNTEILLEKRVPYWSKITNINYKMFKVNDATSKFGSCIPSKKILHFSSRLIMLPEDIIDGVIVHELCHIVYPNHSKDFYNLVRKYKPNYDEINRWLKKNGKVILF